jgi:hypothetical protein
MHKRWENNVNMELRDKQGVELTELALVKMVMNIHVAEMQETS